MHTQLQIQAKAGNDADKPAAKKKVRAKDSDGEYYDEEESAEEEQQNAEATTDMDKLAKFLEKAYPRMATTLESNLK